NYGQTRALSGFIKIRILKELTPIECIKGCQFHERIENRLDENALLGFATAGRRTRWRRTAETAFTGKRPAAMACFSNPKGTVNYKQGELTDWVRIKMTNAPVPDIHSFPASLEQVIKYYLELHNE
ncbi:hypothetical protein SMZ94_004220, partial [Cronobacter sakazakii]|nr:hypothetical protein [Cronobacter sakazakii]